MTGEEVPQDAAAEQPLPSKETCCDEKAADLKVAAGAHNKGDAFGRSKSFMAVPEEKRGFKDVHEHDEGDMLRTFDAIGELAQKLAAETAGYALEKERYVPSMEEVCQNYPILQEGCCGGPSYVAKSVRITSEDVIHGDHMEEHLATCCGAPAHHMADGKVIYHILFRKKNTEFHNTCCANFISWIAHDTVYIMTVSENGIARFHLPPELGTMSKLCFAYADSESLCGFFSNIGHAISNGCFCLGVWYKLAPQPCPPLKSPDEVPESSPGAAEGESPKQEETVPVLVRFNRWNADLTPYWAMVPDIAPGMPERVKEQESRWSSWFACCCKSKRAY